MEIDLVITVFGGALVYMLLFAGIVTDHLGFEYVHILTALLIWIWFFSLISVFFWICYRVGKYVFKKIIGKFPGNRKKISSPHTFKQRAK